MDNCDVDGTAPLSRDEAMTRFQRLVAQYGLQWTARVPREAHEQLAGINKVLTERDRREALGLAT